MAHRSNQAVASQDRPLPQVQPPPDPPLSRRLLAGWVTALAALAISLILLGAGLWFVRFSIASLMLHAALAERGAEANFQVINLDLNGAALANVRFGSETAPDASIPLVEARWRWEGLTPRLHFLRLVRPRLHARLDETGQVSAGALDRIGGAPGRRRPSLPEIELEILQGAASIEAPFGPIEASLEGSGTLGRDFSAIGRVEPVSHPGGAFALNRGEAELIVVSREDNIAFQLTARATALTWANARTTAPTLRILGRAPLDLARYDIEATAGAAMFAFDSVRTEAATVAAGVEAIAQGNALAPQTWAGQMRASAGVFRFGASRAAHARFEARFDGDSARGEGAWTLSASDFAGAALVSANPSADGTLRFGLERNAPVNGEARILLTQSRLDADAQAALRSALPELNGAPVAPTFARARAALGAAANRFDLAIPLAINAQDGRWRIQMTQPAEARAASGATLRLAPLREDTPALVLEWPGPVLSGAVALELGGDGAPDAALLFDTVNWSQQAPFEADGTLTLSNWRAERASIAAEELGVSIVLPPQGGGRLDLNGPLQITGPLGDGEIRDLAASLDIALLWDAGWRVTANNACLPIRIGGLDAAGLSFANGSFSMCALGGTLIASDAAHNLSGGFSIRDLALNGRMAGPEAQPARLGARNLVGRFRGRRGDITLALEAETPQLSIDMGDARRFNVAMQSVTADAHIGESWNIAGAFTAGTLSDPALPGSVSAIAGAWTAQPIDGKPVIGVATTEALLTANRPATDDERILFNPLRLAQVNGELRDGEITASGAILLEESARQIAHFEARHDVGQGVGGARIVAERIVFDQTLQPYQISERARGLVENVRGPIAATANIDWTRSALTNTARVRLDGVSLATATMPVVNNVRGEVVFDDLLTLTTPPGQIVNIGELNPGVSVHDGRVQFQLLSDSRVAVERAEFEFASGTLAMSPTTISLGADETEFELTLRDVEAADLLAALNVPDVTATGRLEGDFPLLLTRRSAFIRGGVLRSQGDGGVLSYTGEAGADATGVSRLAFDALRSFRYDALSVTLDGDLNGDVVSSIEFSGRNSGEPVDLGPIAPVPGLGNVSVRGVPFDFNVRVTAPFNRLAQMAASVTDPGSLIERANPPEGEEPVDPDAQPPR